jgi:hypothetical protein
LESPFVEEEKGWVVKGYVVPYDLPSENVSFLMPQEDEDEEAKMRKRVLRDFVRAKRVQATNYLHSLGVLATNSVILVPASRIDRIDEAIRKVQEIYEEINGRLEREQFSKLGVPVVKKIPMVQTQVIGFRDLAEKKLRERLDEKIDDLASLIQKLQEGVEEAKARSIKYNLNATRREFENLEQIARELGIEAGSQFQLLGEMIDQAIQILEGM